MGVGQLPAASIKKLARELRELQDRPEEGIRVHVSEENVADVQVDYEGPAGTPYEGGHFRMRLAFGEDFPASPPKGMFTTRIFHPNVSKAGEICVNVLKRDWKADLGLRHVLLVIRCLLIEPFPESALNEEAGRLLLEDYAAYAKHARLMTGIHAQPAAKRSTPLTAAGGANAVNSGPSEVVAAAAAPATHTAEAAVPATKKAKQAGEKERLKASAAVAKKRGLKRL